MKTMWPQLLLAGLSIVSSVLAEFFIVSDSGNTRGNLWNKDQQVRKMHCITDEMTSALVWNDNLDWSHSNYADLNRVGEPYVILNNEKSDHSTEDNLTCQMNRNSSCSHYWSRTTNWSYVTSLNQPMAPVYDNRWETFEQKKMSENFQYVDSQLPAVGSLSISIRGAQDAHLALCNEKTIGSFCYNIIIGGWKNTKSVIRKCKNGIPEPASNYAKDNCSISLAEHYEAVLLPTEWKTFVLKWDFITKTEILVYDSKKKLMSYETENIEYPTSSKSSFIFARSTESMLMKFHIYDFSIASSTQSKLTSPQIMTPSSDGNICIEMSISLCDSCLMTIDFIDSTNQSKLRKTFESDMLRNIYDLPMWQSVKVNETLLKTMQQPVRLSINTLSKNITNDKPYWAISNIRRCYDDELKTIEIIAYQDWANGKYFWPNVTCQKFSKNDYSIIDSTYRNLTTSELSLQAQNMRALQKTKFNNNQDSKIFKFL